MSQEAIYRLQARLGSQYLSGGHRTYLISDFNDVAAVGQMTANNATQAAASAASAASSYSLMVALGASAYGVGIDATDLPRVASFPSGGFAELLAALGIFPNTQNGSYQITPHDFGKLLLTTSGTNTWTLPLAADLPEGWFCRWRNRSGNNLTLNRSGADTFNAAATTIALATGTSGMIVRTSSTTLEVF